MAAKAVTEKTERSEEEKQKFKELVANRLTWSAFQSVCQHVITMQSEPQLVDATFNGDFTRSAALLANSSGIVGLVSIFFNQIGGKLSDTVGRKPGLLVGPMGNIILGALVYKNPTSRLVIMTCRVLRMVATTFSSTVMLQAVMGDVFSGRELALLGAKIGSAVGAAIIAMPFVEGTVLARTKNPKLTFLILAALGAIQTFFTSTMLPETLQVKRKVPLTLSDMNPFGFMKIYTTGSKALQKMVTITTLQSFGEGKNVSDFSLGFNKQNMEWSVEQIRNFVSVYGLLTFVSGLTLTPRMLKAMSARVYTNTTNCTNMLAYFCLRPFIEKREWLYYGSVPMMLFGVNGVSANALNAVKIGQAIKEGFGMGEFSAYSNNLRAIVSAMASIILGNHFRWAHKHGWAGSTFMHVGLWGALIPQLLFNAMTPEELGEKKDDTKMGVNSTETKSKET